MIVLVFNISFWQMQSYTVYVNPFSGESLEYM